MGAPSSAVLSEIYLQHLEYTGIIKIIIQNNIDDYFRYVDYTLIIYDENSTAIHEVHREFNSLDPTIKFTIETETENSINFLDISIQNEGNRLSINIYRKPTATDVIIPKVSSHPPEQKQAAIRHLVNRMNSYSLNEDNKKTEYNVIEKILTSNGYETPVIKQFNKLAHKENANKNQVSWAKFTYSGRETKFITKIFKETQTRIAYTANNTIKKTFNPYNPCPQNQYEKKPCISPHMSRLSYSGVPRGGGFNPPSPK